MGTSWVDPTAPEPCLCILFCAALFQAFVWREAHNIHVVVSHESKELSVKHVAAVSVKEQHMMGVFFGQVGYELLSKKTSVDQSLYGGPQPFAFEYD